MTENLLEMENTLEIPSSAVINKNGLGIDFGSSLNKLVYTSKKQDRISLHFVSYTKAEEEEFLSHLKQLVDLYNHDGIIHCTGVAFPKPQAELEQFLGVKIIQQFETDYYATGLAFLAQHCKSQGLFYPPPQSVKEFAEKTSTNMLAAMKHHLSTSELGSLPEPMSEKADGKSKNVNQTGSERDKEKSDYPILLAICGSALNILKVNADGSYERLRTHALSGFSLLSMCSLMAGTTSFQEMVELAERGSPQNLDTTMDDYRSLNNNLEGKYPIFHFGKSTGKKIGDLSREDLAASVLLLHTYNMSLIIQQTASIIRTRQVYFCGGLPVSSYIRNQLWSYYMVHSNMDPNGFVSDAHFVRFGQYLGAVGCLLKSLQPINEI